MAEKGLPTPTPKPVRAKIPSQTNTKAMPKPTTSKNNIPLELKVVIRPVDHQEGHNTLYPPNQLTHLPEISCRLPRADVHGLSLTFSLILSQFYISKVLHIRWISLLICVAQDGYMFCVGYR